MDTRDPNMKTVVSITPISVLADSRTFKEAASFSRFGYGSIVVEGIGSQMAGRDMPFGLRSIKMERRRGGESRSSEKNKGSNGAKAENPEGLRLRMNRSLRQLPDGLKNPLLFAGFLVLYFYRHCLLPLKSIPKASLYYLHSPYQFPAVFLLSRWHRVPFVYDAHDFYPRMEGEAYLPSLERDWIFPFYRKIESWCIKKAAAVVTVNKGIAKLQQEMFGCFSVVIRNCHDDRLDRGTATTLRESVGLGAKAFLLVMIGQAKEGRAIREAIEAMVGLPECVHLAFLGRNYGPYVEGLRLLGLDQRVHFVPPVRPDQVVPFVRTADASLILYYPRSVNDEHSLPNSFFQSISAELPLLYPGLPEISEIAGRHELGIPIDPRLPGSITLAVQRLLEDSGEISRFKRNLREAKHTLSWEQEEGALKNLIVRALRPQG